MHMAGEGAALGLGGGHICDGDAEVWGDAREQARGATIDVVARHHVLAVAHQPQHCRQRRHPAAERK